MAGSKAPYDAIASWYAEWVGDQTDDLATHTLLELTGNVAGQRVLELGCGHGRVARALARKGASVTAVDLSEEMIKLAVARDREEPLGISYLKADVSHAGWLQDEFDGVVASFVLADVAELGSTLATAREAVDQEGWLVFSIPHPCFQGSGGFNGPNCHFLSETKEHPAGRLISGYFEEGHWLSEDPSGVRGKVGAYHRTLASYVNALSKAGWLMDQMREPQPEESDERPPGYHEVPPFLVARCRAR